MSVRFSQFTGLPYDISDDHLCTQVEMGTGPSCLTINTMENSEILINKIDGLSKEIAKIRESVTDEWLRTREAAEYLSISVTQLHNFKREGVLPFSKFGGSLYFRKNDINQILEDNLQEVG